MGFQFLEKYFFSENAYKNAKNKKILNQNSSVNFIKKLKRTKQPEPKKTSAAQTDENFGSSCLRNNC